MAVARAQNVADYLIKKGLSPENMSLMGRSMAGPDYAFKEENGRNRRVRIVVKQ